MDEVGFLRIIAPCDEAIDETGILVIRRNRPLRHRAATPGTVPKPNGHHHDLPEPPARPAGSSRRTAEAATPLLPALNFRAAWRIPTPHGAMGVRE